MESHATLTRGEALRVEALRITALLLGRPSEEVVTLKTFERYFHTAEYIEGWLMCADGDHGARRSNALDDMVAGIRADEIVVDGDRPITAAAREVGYSAAELGIDAGVGQRMADFFEVMSDDQIAWLNNFLETPSKTRTADELVAEYYRVIVENERLDPVGYIDDRVGEHRQADDIAVNEATGHYHRWGGDSWLPIKEFPGFRIWEIGSERRLLWAPGTWPPAEWAAADVAAA